jgi:hypothetical protein
MLAHIVAAWYSRIASARPVLLARTYSLLLFLLHRLCRVLRLLALHHEQANVWKLNKIMLMNKKKGWARLNLQVDIFFS